MCVGKIRFPVLGPIFTMISIFFIAVIMIVKTFKRETSAIPTMIAFISVIETFAIAFNLYVTVYDEQYKYTAFLTLAIFVIYVMNIYNFCFVKNSVLSDKAQKREKINQRKIKDWVKEF